MASPSRSRLPSSVTRHVVLGRPWTARHIQNTHLRYHCRQLGRTFQNPKSTRHLMASYPMPGFAFNAWDARGALAHTDRDWFCHVARGGSIRDAPGTPESLTKRAAHLMRDAGSELTIPQAMRFGQLRALRIPDPFIQAALRHPMATAFEEDGIWCPFFMMVAQEPSLGLDEFVGILHYLRAEIRDPNIKRVSLKERSLRQLRRSARRALRGMLFIARRNGFNYTEADLDRPDVQAHLCSLAASIWPPMKDVAPFEITNEHRWHIVELCTQRDLQSEGSELTLCVASYGSRCRVGKSAIFSLRRWEEDEHYWDPWITIEVDPRSRRIIEMRSIWNDPPIPRELEMVEAWAAENALTFGY